CVSVYPSSRGVRPEQRRGARLLRQRLWLPRVDDEQKNKSGESGGSLGGGRRDRYGNSAGSPAPRHEREGKPARWLEPLWLARDRYRAFLERFAGRLHQ